jgi:hypothetical protein
MQSENSYTFIKLISKNTSLKELQYCGNMCLCNRKIRSGALKNAETHVATTLKICNGALRNAETHAATTLKNL